MVWRVSALSVALTLAAAAQQQVDPKPPPDDDVTAYLKERRAPALRQLALSNLVDAANASLAKGNYADAEEIYHKLMLNYPESPLGVVNLARLYLSQNRRDDFERILVDESTRPFVFPGLYQLIDMATDIKEYDLALAVLTSKLRAKPDAGDLYVHVAAVYRAKGDVGSAVAALRKAAEVTSGFEEANLLLARTLLETGLTREAAAVFQATMQVDPNDAAAVLRRISELLWGSRANVPMIDAFAALAPKFLPQDASVTDGLGWTYYLKDRPALAAALFEKAVTASPGVSAYHYHWGLAAIRTGNRERARGEFQAALACQPTQEERRQIEAMAAAAERTSEMKKQ